MQSPRARSLRHSWTVADAKARFSELITHANESGAQIITRHGRIAAVMVSAELWNTTMKPRRTVAQAVASARGLGVIPSRAKQRREPPQL